ncbi:MAG: hypothetical protein RJA76_475 [Bacteroidota bacterium]|jgi:hypothetical protein
MCHNVILKPNQFKIVYTILLLFFLQTFTLHAQQEAMRMMYPMMPMSINPARAGASKVASIIGFYRKKPLFSLPGMTSLSQQYVSFDMPIQDEKWGFGFLGFNSSQVFADGTGTIASNLGLAGVLSRRFILGDGHEISIGGNIGINQKPVITSNGNTILKASYGLGILYQKRNIQLGMSRPSSYVDDSNSSVSPIYFHGEVLMDLASGDKLRLGSVLKHQKYGTMSDTKVDFYGVYWFQEVVGIGAWYLNSGAEMGNTAFLGSAQVALGRNFMVSYAYDFLGKSITLNSTGSINSSSNDASSGFHQIGIRYEIDLGNGKLQSFRP